MENLETSRSSLAALHDADVTVIRVPRRARTAGRTWRRLIARLRKQQFDVIHAHKFGSNARAVALAQLARIPVVIAHEHIWSPHRDANRLRHWLDREWIARRSSVVIAVSQDGRRRMIEQAGVRPEDVIYIPNGIPDLPAGDPQAVRSELGLSLEDPVIGTVARLRPQKALGVLVEAVARMRARWPRLRALIVGDGPERASLERLIAARELQDTVSLLGTRTDVPDVLSALDIGVCCSDYEGEPLSVLEYMDAAVPVVATRVGGVPQMLDEGRCGVLIPPGDPIALSNAITRLLEEPRLRAELGARGRARKRERYGIDVWIRNIERLYERLLAEASLSRDQDWAGFRIAPR